MSRPLWRTAVAVSVAWPAVAAAQAPVGAEFRVNTYTTAAQSRPAVGMAADGGFVVTWDSLHEAPLGQGGVFGQRFAADGSPLGAEFLVNAYTPYPQGLSSVRASGTGFVVAWQSGFQDGDSFGIFARRFGPDGAPVGGDLRVNTYTPGAQSQPALALGPAGDFVVAWTTPDGSQNGIGAQRIDAAGVPLAGDLRVNTSTTADQRRAAVAADANGNFVVTWEDFNFSHRSLFAQRFDASGVRRGSEFRVNTSTNVSQFGGSSVAMDAQGNFTVAWETFSFGAPPPAPPSEDASYVWVQRFAADGTRIGAEYRVESSFKAESPAVASDPEGNAVVAWRSNTVGAAGIFARRFDAAGAPVGSEFRLDGGTLATLGRPGVGMDAGGDFVAVWEAVDPGTGSSEVHARRFEGRQAAALAVDPSATSSSNGNGVFEAGESVVVAPSWRTFGAAPAFGGSAVAFTGPENAGGPTYSIVDGSASYGPIGGGAHGSCLDAGADCYVLSISQPAARPEAHWDATLDETLTPEPEHGGFARWALHVGDSFADVPRGSPYYRFIETLLHRGVTAGCAAGQYCPASPTTREQMAVFVLLALKGPSYLPPACVPPNTFDDVPESSPYCRWVEALALRQVVGGCATGRYCPADPVTREQMAVFVLRTLDFFLDPPACEPPNMFADVPETSPFCRWVEELARRGVVSGCATGLYCPTQPVTREQMGVFLSVTFGLTL